MTAELERLRLRAEPALLPFIFVVWFSVCLIPFTFLPWKIPFFQMAPDHGAIILLAVFGLFIFPPNRSAISRSPYFWCLVVYVGTLLVATAFSGDVHRSFRSVVGFVLRGFVPFYLAFHLAGHVNDRRFRTAAVVLGVALGLVAIAEVANGRFLFTDYVPDTPFLEDSLWRDEPRVAIGAMGQPLPLSFLAAMLLPFAVERGFSSKSPWTMALVFPLIACIFLTYRRTAYGAAVLVILAACYAFRHRPRRMAVCLGAPLALLAGLLLFPSSRAKILERFHPDFTLGEINRGQRRTAVATSLRMWSERPWVGIGPRMYEMRISEFSVTPRERPAPDNQYLRNLAEAGIPGLLALFLIVTYPLARQWRARRIEDFSFLLMNIVFVPGIFFVEGISYPTTLMTFALVNGLYLGRRSNEMGRAGQSYVAQAPSLAAEGQ